MIEFDIFMKYFSNSEDETKKVGRKIGKNLSTGDVLGLYGKLATGKTIFTKAVLEGLGMKETRYVKSPSFIIMREYEINEYKVYHFDLYRVDTIKEIQEIGWNELIDSGGICIIEWAQRADEIMPSEYLKVNLSIKGNHSRELSFIPKGKKYENLVKIIGKT